MKVGLPDFWTINIMHYIDLVRISGTGKSLTGSPLQEESDKETPSVPTFLSCLWNDWGI